VNAASYSANLFPGGRARSWPFREKSYGASGSRCAGADSLARCCVDRHLWFAHDGGWTVYVIDPASDVRNPGDDVMLEVRKRMGLPRKVSLLDGADHSRRTGAERKVETFSSSNPTWESRTSRGDAFQWRQIANMLILERRHAERVARGSESGSTFRKHSGHNVLLNVNYS